MPIEILDLDKPADKTTVTSSIKEVTGSDEIAAFLSDYKSPAIVKSTEPVSPVNTPIEQIAPMDGQRLDPNLYYVKGKKKGQLKPEHLRNRFPVSNVAVNTTQQQTFTGNALITGALLLTLIDLILPIIITSINNRFTGDKMKPEALQLSTSDKKNLEPLANEAAKMITFSSNPMVLFLVGLVGIYGTNFLAAKIQGTK